MEAIGSLSQVTPEWIAACLDESLGVAPRISEVKVLREWKTIVSTVARLEVAYSGPVPAGLPTHLFLKTRKEGAPGRSGPREVAFYTRVTKLGNPLPVPRCFSCAVEEEKGDFHILLEDLSLTHAGVCEWPIAPTREQCEKIIEAIARLHAAWWRSEALLSEPGFVPTASKHQEHAQWARQAFASFSDFMQDRLSPRRREIYERVLSVFDKLLAHHWDRGSITLTHGDAHVWNFMYPNDPAGKVHIIDWDLWGVGAAAVDLAYMMALFWFPDRRAIHEKPLLKHYWNTLVSAGVTGVSFDHLWDDYRLAVAKHLVAPLWQQTHKLNAGLWWPHFERITLAYDDLDCDELIKPLGA